MKIRYIVVIFFIAAILCGCQPNPQNEIVTSKNNGVFEDIIQHAPLVKQKMQENEKNIGKAVPPSGDTA